MPLNFLVIGCGSIGKRHARNITRLGQNVILCDIDENRLIEFSKEIVAVATYNNYLDALANIKIDGAVIATPSSIHFEPAKVLIMAGIPILMEKPLCSSVEEGYTLYELLLNTNTILMMGHTYRFREEWQNFKRIIESNVLGEIYSAEIMGGWYLPDWHIHCDYRDEYAAQKKLGGGVMLTSMSHLFDIVNWFFGDVKRFMGYQANSGKLEIDADDQVGCFIQTENNIFITLVRDFLNRNPRNEFRINAEYGYMTADFNMKTLKIWDSREKRFQPDSKGMIPERLNLFKILEDGVAYDMEPSVKVMPYSGNDAYLCEVEVFIECINNGVAHPGLDIRAGLKVLELINHEKIEQW